MTDWAKLKVVDLKAELKRRGLPINGLKTELVARLDAAEAEQEQESAQGAGDQDPQQGADDAGPAAAEEEALAPAENGAPAAAIDDAPAETKLEPESVPEPELEAAAAAQPEATDHVEQPALQNGHVAETPIEASEAPSAEPLKSSDAPAQHEDAAPAQPTQTEQAPAAPESAEDSSIPPQADESMKIDEAASEEQPTDSATDSQKRKRRSLSPPPDEESVARKRARAEEEDENAIAPVVRLESQGSVPRDVGEPEAMDTTAEPEPKKSPSPQPMRKAESPAQEEAPRHQDTMEIERDVAPAMHPATPALYICNLMRPLRPNDMQMHLADLATPRNTDLVDDVISKFYLDQIRTHAYVIFNSTSAASRVRSALHDSVWPNESNRKALWVDFIPPEKVADWIETEESSGGGRSGARWEVVYGNGPDGAVEARLETTSAAASRGAPPTGPKPRLDPMVDRHSSNNIPIGPRGYREPVPPTGPRASRPGLGPAPGPRPLPPLSGTSKTTRARPSISYQYVSNDLVDRRIDNMRSFYTTDDRRSFGSDINRYSFEGGDAFVDRGKEVFEGIRPPHRGRGGGRGGGLGRRGGGGGGGGGGRRGRRGGGGGGGGGGGWGGFRPQSDRYLPGRNGNEGRLPRFDEDVEMGGAGGGSGGGGGASSRFADEPEPLPPIGRGDSPP